MSNQKQMWDHLAKTNSKYFIYSSKGKSVNDKDFRNSGLSDYTRHIHLDPSIQMRFDPKETTLLEIGCGTGRMTEFMSKNFKKVIGIDISAEMIRQGKERLKDCKNVELIETDGLTIPLPDNSVDFCFSYLVFQHFKTKEMVQANFGEVNRVLKDKGLFKVLLRVDRIPDEFVKQKWWGGVYYDDSSIRLLCDLTGFKLDKSEPVEDHSVWLWLTK